MDNITLPETTGEIEFEDFLAHNNLTEQQFDDMLAHYGLSEEDFDQILVHYGIKGMRWGVRKKRDKAVVETPVEVRARPGRRVEARGGSGQPAHEDAISTAASKQKARQSTVDALSTPELKKLVERMNLEAQYAKLAATQPTRIDAGKKFISGMAKDEVTSILRGKKGPVYGTIDAIIQGRKGIDPSYKGKHRSKN